MGAILILYYVNPTVTFRDYTITLKDLLFDSIYNIIHLQVNPGIGGSMVDRTNAIIYGVRELINSKFLGIGWGNSVMMLSTSQYSLLSAESMHNLVVQFLCEMGNFAIIVYFNIFKWIVSNVKNFYKHKNYLIKSVFIISFIVISSQSSVGILSNYYTWIIIFYIAFLPVNQYAVSGENYNP